MKRFLFRVLAISTVVALVVVTEVTPLNAKQPTEQIASFGSPVTTMAVDAQGQHIYFTQAPTATLSVLDVATQRVIHRVSIGRRIKGVAISSDNSKIYATVTCTSLPCGPTVDVVNLATGEISGRIDVGGSALAIALVPGGQEALVISLEPRFRTDTALTMINTATNQVMDQIEIPANASLLTVSPNGRWAYVASGAGSDGSSQTASVLDIVDLSEKAVVRSVNNGQFVPCGLAVSPNGQTLFESFCAAGSIDAYRHLGVSIFNPSSLKLESRIPAPNGPRGIAFNKSGSVAYVSMYSSIVSVRAVSGKVIGRVPLSFAPASGPNLLQTINGGSVLVASNFSFGGKGVIDFVKIG